MKSGEKQALEQSNVSQSEPLRAPTSIEEAYERGWRWHVESFADLTMFESTVKSVTQREGLAHFKGPEGEIVIPFVASYAFGEPRVPKQPYRGGAVYSVDEEAAPQESPAPDSSEKEADEEKLWRVRQMLRGRVIHTYTNPIPMTEEHAVSDAFEAYTDELHLDVSEVKIKASGRRKRTKKAKARR